MNNKFLVNIYIPLINQNFDVFIPKKSKVKSIVWLMIKVISKNTNNQVEYDKLQLYNCNNGLQYDQNSVVQETDISTGSKLIIT